MLNITYFQKKQFIIIAYFNYTNNKYFYNKKNNNYN